MGTELSVEKLKAVDVRSPVEEKPKPTPFNINIDGVTKFKISPQTWVFVQEYVATSDPAQSYIKAFQGSPHTARNNGKKLLARPEVQEVVWALYAELLPDTKDKRKVLMALIHREATNDEAKPMERLKALELWAKMDAMVTDEDFSKNRPMVPVVHIHVGGSQPAPEVIYDPNGPKATVKIGPDEHPIEQQVTEIIDADSVEVPGQQP